MVKKVRVIIVDDHEIFRKGLILTLNELDYVTIIGEAGNGNELLEIMEKNPVDIVFLDIKMPELDGEETATILVNKFPDVKILVLSMYGIEYYLEKMINIGVSGFLLKNVNKDILSRAIQVTQTGGNYFSEELLTILTQQIKKKNTPENEIIDTLSQRELEILKGICLGLSSQEIAENLSISVRTVEGHKSSLIKKTGVINTLNLVIYTIKNNIIKL